MYRMNLFPDCTTLQNWYNIKLFKSDNSDVDGARILTEKKTHINRGSAARMADPAGVNEAQIRRLGI